MCRKLLAEKETVYKKNYRDNYAKKETLYA